MDELERRVAEGLSRPAPEPGRPPEGLGRRIVSGTAARKRRRRATAAAVGFAVVAAAFPMVLGFPTEGNGRGPASVSASRDGNGAGSASPAPNGPAVVPRVLPNGDRFRAVALGRDGSVLGTAESVDGEGTVTPRRGVWLAGPGGSAPARIHDTSEETLPYLWTMANGATARIWPDGETLTCLPASGNKPAHPLGEGWDGREPFYAERDLIVWWDAGEDALSVAAGCDGPVRTLPVEGTLEAFADPYAYVRAGRTMQQVDVRSGASAAIPLPPVDDPSAGFAAGPGALAWADGDTLTVQKLGPGGDRRVLHDLPYGRDDEYIGRITIGDGVVVYSASHQDRDTGAAMVYDLRTGRRSPLPGEALAAGDRLLWRDGDTYRLTR